MAAEINNYFQVDAKFRGPNDVVMKINPAKAQWTLAEVKAFFWLDGVIAFTANVAGTMYHGFWGTCIVGGSNESMHRTNRIVNIYGSTLGQSKRTFNDSGLNTKGTVQAPIITNNRVGNLTGSIVAKSAYFVDSDMIKWQFSVNGSEWSIPANIQGLGQRIEQTLTFGHNSLFKAGDKVYFRGQIDNSEGTFIGPNSVEVQIRVRLVILSSNTYASNAYFDWQGRERENYYTDSLPLTFGIGTRLFSNDPPNFADVQEAPAIHYSDGQFWYRLAYVPARDRLEITEQGSVTSSSGYPDNWPTNDPNYDALASNDQQGTYYEGNNYEDACLNGQNQNRPVTIWLRTTVKGVQTYYRDQAGQLSLTGYFHTGGGVWQFNGGARVGNQYMCAN